MPDPKKIPCFELRHATFDTLLLIVKTMDIEALCQALQHRFEATPEFFANDSVLIDLRPLALEIEADTWRAMERLAQILRQMQMCPIGIIATDAQRVWAGQSRLPLVEWPEPVYAKPPPISAPPAAATLTEALASTEGLSPSAQIVDTPLRSGQRVYARGDLIVLKPVNHGAEILSEGHIHLYAPLRGRALAGVRGNRTARIFCAALEAELISIAGFYQTGETSLPTHLHGKPVQVSLFEEKLVIQALKFSSL